MDIQITMHTYSFLFRRLFVVLFFFFQQRLHTFDCTIFCTMSDCSSFAHNSRTLMTYIIAIILFIVVAIIVRYVAAFSKPIVICYIYIEIN